MQSYLFDQPPPLPNPHGRAKCRRTGCGHVSSAHGPNGCNGATGFCLCDGFLSEPEARRICLPAPSNAAYREAYESGIRRASPQPFALLGARVGSLLGPLCKAHALDAAKVPLTGEALLKWIEQAAHDFRKATAGEPHYWGGWQVMHFCRWQNMRLEVAAHPAKAAKPAPVARKQPGVKRKQT